MSGSPKKPPPMKNVVIFINIEDEVTSAIATAGTSTPASLTRALSSGKGGVGDSKLRKHISIDFNTTS